MCSLWSLTFAALNLPQNVASRNSSVKTLLSTVPDQIKASLNKFYKFRLAYPHN